MTEKRFKLIEDYDWWGITDNQLPKTEYGFREDLSNHYLSCDYKYNDLTHQEVVDLLNNLSEENEQLKQQEKRLYKYFRKCFDNISEQGFRETWEVVKKYD